VTRRAARAGALAFAAQALCGCGLATLTYDSTIGPITPVGRIHELTVGEDIHVGEDGVQASLGDTPRLRPYPRDLIRRLAQPSSFWFAAQGLQAFLRSFSPLASRETHVGKPMPPGTPAELQPGAPLASTLELLGPPDLWLRRKSGSLLLYRDASKRTWSFYVGVPPPATWMVPIPFIGSLRFRYISERARAEKLMLFFDPADALIEARWGVDSDLETDEPEADAG
jgi:hypothetical protein